MTRSACLLFAACMLPLPAAAGSITVANTTAITAYQGNAPAAYFGGANPYVAQSSIGTDFQTTSLTVQTTDVGNNVVVDFAYTTQFPGSEIIDGATVSNADIFFAAGNSYGAQGFTYAISLGAQTQNGGLAAGFYSVNSAATSMDIWSPRTQFIFGGAYGASAAALPGQPGYTAYAAPTVLTSGNFLSNAAISEDAIGGGYYLLDAQITMTAAQAAQFSNGMDVFWGTGDCGNGAFLAELSALPMPEPCSAAILASGLFYVVARRKSPEARVGKRRLPWLTGWGRLRASRAQDTNNTHAHA